MTFLQNLYPIKNLKKSKKLTKINSEDISKTELTIKFEMNQLSEINDKEKENDNDEFNCLNSSSSSLSYSSYYSESSDNSSQNKNENIKRGNGNKKRKRRKRNTRINSDKLCKQALYIIKFLGTLQTKILHLKYELRQRIVAFLESVNQLEIVFSSDKYTKNGHKDYSTKTKRQKSNYKVVDILIYTAASTFMDKSTRISPMMYKNQDSKLLGYYI